MNEIDYIHLQLYDFNAKYKECGIRMNRAMATE